MVGVSIEAREVLVEITGTKLGGKSPSTRGK